MRVGTPQAPQTRFSHFQATLAARLGSSDFQCDESRRSSSVTAPTSWSRPISGNQIWSKCGENMTAQDEKEVDVIPKQCHRRKERYVSPCDHVNVGQYSHNCMNCENYIGIILSVQLWHQMIAVCSCQLIFHQLHHRQISSFAFQCSLLVRSMNAGSLDVRSVFAWSQSFSTILQYLITCL